VNSLFLAWRDPLKRGWYTIGRLRHTGQFFEFVYTRGMLDAHTDAGFRALPSFPDPDYRYLSVDLFPLFSNRLPNPTRPDYQDFAQYLISERTQLPLRPYRDVGSQWWTESDR
jgi:hypothetical protein